MVSQETWERPAHALARMAIQRGLFYDPQLGQVIHSWRRLLASISLSGNGNDSIRWWDDAGQVRPNDVGWVQLLGFSIEGDSADNLCGTSVSMSHAARRHPRVRAGFGNSSSGDGNRTSDGTTYTGNVDPRPVTGGWAAPSTRGSFGRSTLMALRKVGDEDRARRSSSKNRRCARSVPPPSTAAADAKPTSRWTPTMPDAKATGRCSRPAPTGGATILIHPSSQQLNCYAILAVNDGADISPHAFQSAARRASTKLPRLVDNSTSDVRTRVITLYRLSRSSRALTTPEDGNGVDEPGTPRPVRRIIEACWSVYRLGRATATRRRRRLDRRARVPPSLHAPPPRRLLLVASSSSPRARSSPPRRLLVRHSHPYVTRTCSEQLKHGRSTWSKSWCSSSAMTSNPPPHLHGCQYLHVSRLPSCGGV